ncbi:hypothetical protein DPMN_123629 [Dreissena polymorpha]|uniref:Uncharacterized protein n=1 Tax=Dreissena polymorpha TaxID=45954 RepID=A0A9D4GUT7_DREPO|nr:hypothetical protein DPMN_123629 [Dreissena polymorpha]
MFKVILKQRRLVITSGAFFVLIIRFYLTRQPYVSLKAPTSNKEDMSVTYTDKVLYNHIKDIKAVEEVTEHVLSSASSGESFTGEPIRKFNPQDILFRKKHYPPTSKEYIPNATCTRWAVLTTIFSPPSEAVRRFLYMKNWCVVIIGDKNKHAMYSLKSSLKNRHIVFLSDSDQENIKLKFVDNLPWRNFGRKNVGYLYAIAHGAEYIWDFDDDNMLKFWIDGASPSDSLWIDNYLDLKQMYMKGMPVSIVTSGVNLEFNNAQFFNPYPMLGAPYSNCWPRGYPLTLIHKSSNQGVFKLTKFTENIENILNNIGVLQSLADHEPDVDALYRLIQGTPFKFKRPAKGSGSQPTILLSKGVYTPFNAQATLHFIKAFLALYLPVTVSGRVSDIWRS